MRTIYFAAIVVLFISITSFADVRIKQRVTTSGQKFESTRSIKGSRERTEQKIQMEDAAMADYMPQIATITQCDMRRSVRLNDRKQLYMIEPFQTQDAAPLQRTTPAATQTTTRRGGTMTMTYTVKDTGERKTMFGLQARHLIIMQEMESSPDSCNGPTKMKMEFDGWYADFSADFNCPNAQAVAPQMGMSKPDCTDHIIYKGNSAAARTGFLLDGTMKMFGTDGSVSMTTTTETLELSRAPLEASLFDIPAFYKQASSTQDLYAVSMPGMGAVMDNSGMGSRDNRPSAAPGRPMAKSVALNISLAPGSAANQAEIEQYVKTQIAGRGLRTATGAGDYTLNIQFRLVKESTASKIGGFLGKAAGVDTKVGKVDIDMIVNLSGAGSGEAKVKNKFDGPATDAVHAAIDQALSQLLRDVEN